MIRNYYTWNKKWIWKYQSIWCTIERFKYSNELTENNFKKHIKSSPRKITIFNSSSLYMSKYYFNEKILIELFEKDVFEYIKSSLKEVFGSLYNIYDIEKYMIKEWRFCPKCIKKGYHSIFHQLNFYDKCIYHDIPLENKCPNCNKVKPYVLGNRNNIPAFTCECGYNYLENINFYDLIKIWNKDINIFYKYITNINIPNYKYFFSSFNYYLNNEIYKNRDYYLKNNLFMYNILKKNLIKNKYIFKFKPTLYENDICTYKKYIFTDVTIDELEYMIANQYIAIFKSIGKHIRKKIRRKNYKFYFSKKNYFLLDCVKNNESIIKYKMQYKDIDEYLYSYIMWRKNVEGHSEYYQIHTKLNLNDKLLFHFRMREHIYNSIFFKYINYEIKNYLFIYKRDKKNIPFSNYGILLSGLERIIGDILLKYFNDWHQFIKNKKNNNPNEIVDFNASIKINMKEYLICYDQYEEVEYIIKL